MTAEELAKLIADWLDDQREYVKVYEKYSDVFIEGNFDLKKLAVKILGELIGKDL